uniref:NXPE family member 3-like n=1 Tax=Styela clava TaxID=7725 RepID=UPI00193AB662|nr:NXPE family member 3-like [Styela clava]
MLTSINHSMRQLSKNRQNQYLAKFVIVFMVLLYLIYANYYAGVEENIRFKISSEKTLKGSRILLEDKLRTNLLSSSWIKLFPHLEHMVESRAKLTAEKITSPINTVVKLIDRKTYKTGELFNATITAYDELGYRKKYGGDFFMVTLGRQSYKNDGVSCEVYDEKNGSYHVTCFLLWPGNAVLRVVLIHPSESIYELMKMYSSESEWGVRMEAIMLNSKQENERTVCSIGFPETRSDELCDLSNPTHGEKWTCLKPSSGECSNITWMQKVANESKLLFWDNKYFRDGYNSYIEIKGSGAAIRVQDSVNPPMYPPILNRRVGVDPSTPTGWVLNSRWISFGRGIHNSNTIRLRQCAAGKEFYFIGDSTLRLWHSYFAQVLHIKQEAPTNPALYSQPQDGYKEDINTSIHYRAHGPPMHNPGPVWVRPFITDTLDSIKNGGRGTYVIITLGLHFELYDADIFGERIRMIKTRIKSLLSRHPGIKVFVKGLHHHEHTPLCPTSWITFRYDVMLRHEFVNMKGVVFLPMWDFSVLRANKDLHPQGDIFTTQIGMFLSYIC